MRILNTLPIRIGHFVQSFFALGESYTLIPQYFDFTFFYKYLSNKMFDDRLVFETPGDLPVLVRPDNIRHTHFSRNPKIAQYLKAYKYVKEFGEGIDRICNELETRGSAIPSFHINAFILKATLKAEWTEKDTSATNTGNNVHKDVHKDVHKEISERQSLIISMIQDNPDIGRIEMSTKLGVNEKTIRRDLDDLKEKGIVVRVGGRKEGHWEISQ